MRSTRLADKVRARWKDPILTSLFNETHPLAKTLREIFLTTTFDPKTKLEKPTSAGLRRVQWQNDITSEKLCDDLIQYLAPTLEQHRGATIIDVNPGACVWSSKLHDFLQPRCHLLMEPDKRYYNPFIKPLLDRPGSKYTYTPLAGAHSKSYWSNYYHILNDEKLLPPRPPLKVDDPKLRQIDTNMLLIGNLWRNDEYSLLNTVSLAPLVLQHMLYGALSNDIIHRSGLVRMLWWIPEGQLIDVLAPNTQKRSSLATQLAAGSNIVQVAGNRSMEELLDADIIAHRTYTWERPSALSQIAWMKDSEKGASQPVDRDQLTTSSSVHDLEASSGPNPLTTTLTSFDQLHRAVQTFRDDVLPLFANGTLRKGKPSISGAEILQAFGPLAYPQLEALIKSSRWLLGKYAVHEGKCVAVLDVSLRYIHLEAELAALVEDAPVSPEAEAATESVRQLGKELDVLIESACALILCARIEAILEHLLAAFARPRIVTRDMRPFEPLKTTSDEMWPNAEMALIMMTPATHDFVVPDAVSGKEAAQLFRDLIKQLGHSRAISLPDAIDRIAPGAAREMIAQVPAITDVRKGGRLDPRKVTPRMLSDEMLVGLVKAYIDWPFRPADLAPMLSDDHQEQQGDIAFGGNEESEDVT